jgi:hypothetical protein
VGKMFSIVAMLCLSAANAQETQTVPAHVGGTISVLKDGVVTCFVYDTSYSGGIDCDGDISKVDLSRLAPGKWTTESGEVGRQVLDGRLCYTMDGSYSGGISCLKPNKQK